MNNNEKKVMRSNDNENKGISFEKARKMIKDMETQKSIIMERIAGIIMDAGIASSSEIDTLLANFPYTDRYEIMKEVAGMTLYKSTRN